MNVKGAEAVEVALANTLVSYLPDMLSQVEAAWASYDTAAGLSVPLLSPAQVYAGRRTLIREHPSVMVVSAFGQEVDDGAPLWGQQRHRVDIVTFCAADALEVVDRQSKRYLVAIWEVLKQHQDLDGSLAGLAGVMTTQYGRSDPYQNARKILEQQAAWEVLVTVMESV